MQRFKVYVDVENIVPERKSRQKDVQRQALGEIKNTILTRSKYLELKKDIKKIKIKDQVKQKTKRSIVTKKAPSSKRVESNDETNKSPEITRRRRLSSLFRVSEYANDIYKYLQRIEDKYPISSNAWMEIRFGENTRFALVDWLVEINEHFQFVHETFQLCVSIIDRYIQDYSLNRRKDLQLIALAAVFIASKYEEIIPMEINDLLFVCDSSLSAEEILKMEMKIVTEMQYSFGRPVPAHFVRRYCNVTQATGVEQSCAFYLTDVALMSYKLCYMKPSIIAASALYIALCVSNGVVDQSLWNLTLIKYSTYGIQDFEDCLKTLARCLKKAKSSRYQAIEKKYSKQEYFNVSQIPELETVIEALGL